MSGKEKVFHELIEENFEQLDVYSLAITRAHGKSHPEAFKVRELFEVIQKKITEAGKNKPDLDDEFLQLRQVTDSYKIPGDVCGTYVGVYEMLAELDQAYQAE